MRSVKIALLALLLGGCQLTDQLAGPQPLFDNANFLDKLVQHHYSLPGPNLDMKLKRKAIFKLREITDNQSMSAVLTVMSAQNIRCVRQSGNRFRCTHCTRKSEMSKQYEGQRPTRTDAFIYWVMDLIDSPASHTDATIGVAVMARAYAPNQFQDFKPDANVSCQAARARFNDSQVTPGEYMVNVRGDAQPPVVTSGN